MCCPQRDLTSSVVSDAHRLSRDDGRPRQDAASGDSRRHPRAPRPSGRSGGARAARHRPRRSRRRQPVSVCRRRGESPRRRSTRSSRKSTSAGPRWCEPRPRTSATCSLSSIQRTTRGVLAALDETPEPRHSASISRARPSPTPRPTTPRSPRRWQTIRLDGATFERTTADGTGAFAERLNCRSRKSATCATAKTLTSVPPGIPRDGQTAERPASAGRHPARKGTVVHEPARPRRCRPDGPRIRRARGRRREAHEPVRGRDRQLGGRRVCPRPRRGLVCPPSAVSSR